MILRFNSIIVLFLLTFATAHAQKVDLKLEQKLKKEIADFRGDIGIYVHQLKSNKIAAVNADTTFPTASIVKVPILVGVFQKVAQGELKLEQPFQYSDKRAYGGSGLMQFYKDSAQTDLSTMISLMLTYSDNVTSIWLQELAGGGAQINPLMNQLGLTQTKVNSRTKGREKIWEEYGWGQTTPREMAKLFTLIRNGQVIDQRHSDKMYRYLKNQFYNGRSLSQIPSWVNTIAKTGSVDRARGEVVLVNAPSGDYVFCILTKNNEDASWTDKNEAEELTRRLSSIIWNHFEPKHPFQSFAPIK
ncbi:serine hydrolase [Sphingobacterium faecale]|uniref:serine hydrolase n=1 Tax=Sphingobacterium faecale TaxID=2803775 RepID=UPI001F234C06|nr:serine hydrolase [Sphingobacterium faecale]